METPNQPTQQEELYSQTELSSIYKQISIEPNTNFDESEGLPTKDFKINI